MRWEEPLVTACLLGLFVAVCVWVDAERAGILPFLALLAALLVSARDRLRGAPRARHFLDAAQSLDQQQLGEERNSSSFFRPLAHVKVSVCAGRSLKLDDAKRPDTYVENPASDEKVMRRGDTCVEI